MSHSYLEHLVALRALRSGEYISIGEILDNPPQKIKHSPHKKNSVNVSGVSHPELRKNKLRWLICMKKYGISKAIQNGGGTSYYFLRRHANSWLLRVNLRYRKNSPKCNGRVNWHSRDVMIVRNLIKIRDEFLTDIDSEWRTKEWYLKQLKSDMSSVKIKKTCQDFLSLSCFLKNT